jgi:3-deoxy-D-manno-octulosonic-acid transferase
MMVVGLPLYRAATTLAAPVLDGVLTRRARDGKEDPSRLPERKGVASAQRPEGKLAWLHAASVGESLVALSLAEGLTEAREDLSILITSGTRTSAALVERRGVMRTVHQYPPVDRPGWAKRFIAHWKPDLVVFTESELWPNLIMEAERSGAPLALVNARMNDSSLRGWLRWPGTAMRVLNAFDWIGAADARTQEGLALLTEREIPQPGNLKLEAGLPEPDPADLAEVRAAIAERPVFVAASTHAGEEALLAEALVQLRTSHPDALMILAPRHPERADEIAAILTRSGHAITRRSRGETPGAGDTVWLADTLGEMALWYAAAPVALICGSFLAAIGGHNPIEATRAGAVVITGPYADSFADIYAAYDAVEARGMALAEPGAIAEAIRTSWSGHGPTLEAGQAALARLPGGARAATLDALLGLLDRKTAS